MLSKTSRFWSVVALVLSSSLITPSWGRANERVSEFNIPPQSLDSALLVFAEQADVQVSVSTVIIAGMKTQGVVGRFTPSVALARLLTETGLQFTTVGDRTYSVSQARSGSARNGKSAARERESMMALEQGEAADSSAISPTSNPEAMTQRSAGPINRESSLEDIQDEVIVTGTHIRGGAPIGVVLITIDRAEIDRMGYGTVQEVVKSLPQNFGGGPSEDTGLGLEAFQNTARSSGLNLRGLGAGSTLILVNGRRMAPGGGEGRFTDVSSIPLTAIERIDVLPDGASAIYGSDAVGGVVNFILRKDYDGAETRARFGAVDAGGLEEHQLGQALGTEWGSGQGLVSYEYYKRDALRMSARELTASMDLRPFGGTDRRDLLSNPGTIAIGATTWAIPPGQDGTALDPQTLVAGTSNRENLNESRDLLPEQQRHSLVASVRQDFGAAWTTFADLLYTRRDALLLSAHDGRTMTVTSVNPFYVNPMGGTGPISVRYRFTDDLGRSHQDIEVQTYSATLGASVVIADQWSLTLSGSYSGEEVEQIQDTVSTTALNAALLDPNPATALNPFGDGSNSNPATLEGIRAKSAFDSTSDFTFVTVIAEGPLFSLPGGDLRLALGSEYREQEFGSINSSPGFLRETDFSRDVAAAFAEFRAPWVDSRNRRAGIERLELSIAGRYERYSDFGDALTPRVGIDWSPVGALSVRGAWSRSYKAPNLADLTEVFNNATILSMPDPQTGTNSPVLIWAGKNRDLQEERATSWTLGAVFNPLSLPGLRLEANYFDIEFEDRIEQLAINLTLLSNPRFASLITRNPSAAQREDVCARSPVLVGINSTQCLTAPVAALADVRVRNTALTRNRGVDLIAGYEFDTAWGQFDLQLNTTYLLDFEQALLDVDPLVELVDTVTNPLRLRGRASLGWRRDGFGATLFVNHIGAYRDTANVPNRELGSLTTLDLQLGYESHSRDYWLADLSVSFNVQNVFDEDPPFFNNSAGVGYDRENADLLGRFFSLQIRKGW